MEETVKNCISCDKCNEITFDCIPDYIKHLRKAHNLRTNLKCGILLQNKLTCGNSVNTYTGLKKHMKNCFGVNVNKAAAANENHLNDILDIPFTQANNEENVLDDATQEEQNLLIDAASILNGSSDVVSEPEPKNANILQEASIALKKSLNFFSSLNIPISAKNQVFCELGDIVKQFAKLSGDAIHQSEQAGPVEIIDVCCDYVCGEIREFSSNKRRSTIARTTETYVAPIPHQLGMYWDTTRTGLTELKPSTFQFVPITETLEKKFLSQNFVEEYMAYNSSHACQDGVYSEFCCGEVYGKSDFFSANEFAVQYQLSCDEFEPTSELKSKTSTYKIHAIYGSIRNIPIRMRSKLKSKDLVCLFFSSDTKDNRDAYNSIWKLITNEIRKLETEGIKLPDGSTIKGSLSNVTYDNAGGNQCFGFVESFNATHYCRICEMPKSLCQSTCIEDIDMLRTKESYDAHIKELTSFREKKEIVDFVTTKGVKNVCVLNELTFFHVTSNLNVDVMHDICEGIIPFLIKNLCLLCYKAKILSEDDLNSTIQLFNFGILNTDKRPSTIITTKANCNQNASQNYVLMTHLPFILYDEILSNKILMEAWTCVTSLLQIMEIVYSPVIKEIDLQSLSKLTETHLSSIQKHFKLKLTPKHHLIVHYPTVIRRMGPVVHTSMIRHEAKHRQFTKIVDMKGNYKNLLKMLANEHQDSLTKITDFTENDIKTGLRTNILCYKSDAIQNHYPLLQHSFENFNDISIIKSLKINDYIYKPSLYLYVVDSFYKIDFILTCEAGAFHFICEQYRIIGKNVILNSLEILETGNYLTIHLDSLKNVKSYEAKNLHSKLYIIDQTLETSTRE